MSLVSTEVAPGVRRFEKVAASGWCWNMLAVALPGGGLLVHSPTWLGEGTFEALEALGPVRVLFAPSHFHHMEVERFRQRFPDALPVASERALPRLSRQGHAGMKELAEAESLLPPGATWTRCEGTRSGEAWISLPGDAGPTWLVSDAFFNVERPVSGSMGFLLRSLAVVPGLRVARTFRWVAVDDIGAYTKWVLPLIERARPFRVVPSHGEPVSGAGLPERLANAVRERLGG